MGLRKYILKRAVSSIVLVFLVITLNFIIFVLMPGNPMMRLANPSKFRNTEQYNEQMERFGLLDPVHVKYAKYLQSMLTFQFGYSYFTFLPIYHEIGSRLSITLTLVITEEIIAIVLGIVVGVIAASKRGKLLDASSVLFSIITNSLPVFWVGMLLVLIFSYQLHWFPSGMPYPAEWQQRWPTNFLVELTIRIQHLFLPVLALVIITVGSYLLLTRASMIEVLSEDYLVTARAKGLTERKVLFKHALKNASLPVLTQAAIAFGFMLSGAIVTEQVFSYPGLGQWIWRSIEWSDFPALQAIFFIIALCVIIANFIADIAYGVIDPRIKYG